MRIAGFHVPAESPFVVLIPVFDDWVAARGLLHQLDTVLEAAHLAPCVLLVDDGSTAPMPADLVLDSEALAHCVYVLRLRRNLGHQRAIAVGLAFLAEHLSSQPVVVMDGDGEDDPRDVLRLWRCHQERGGDTAIVFAERRRRSESSTFRVFYRLYRLGHYVLTGHRVRVGNFSLIPFPTLQRLAVVSELWNHYAAAVLKARLPHTTIETQRASRIGGESKMNFASLVTHGLSAMSVHDEIIGARSLAAIGAVGLLSVLAVTVVITIRLTTDLAIPGWATMAIGILLVVFMQSLTMALVFAFMILGLRNSSTFLPLRDYHYFIYNVARVLPQ